MLIYMYFAVTVLVRRGVDFYGSRMLRIGSIAQEGALQRVALVLRANLHLAEHIADS